MTEQRSNAPTRVAGESVRGVIVSLGGTPLLTLLRRTSLDVNRPKTPLRDLELSAPPDLVRAIAMPVDVGVGAVELGSAAIHGCEVGSSLTGSGGGGGGFAGATSRSTIDWTSTPSSTA